MNTIDLEVKELFAKDEQLRLDLNNAMEIMRKLANSQIITQMAQNHLIQSLLNENEHLRKNVEERYKLTISDIIYECEVDPLFKKQLVPIFKQLKDVLEGV